MTGWNQISSGKVCSTVWGRHACVAGVQRFCQGRSDVVKHTKSNTIVFVKNDQLLASGVGQTSRVDALKQAIVKAEAFKFDLNGSVMASDAFFPFPDCVEIAAEAGIKAWKCRRRGKSRLIIGGFSMRTTPARGSTPSGCRAGKNRVRPADNWADPGHANNQSPRKHGTKHILEYIDRT